MTCSIKLLDW